MDIVGNGAVQKGMPHKYYHGKTGIVYNDTKTSVGVICYKIVGNRYLEKRVNIRIEHIRHSKCRNDFLKRVKENAAKRKAAKDRGETIHLKRQPAMPRETHKVQVKPDSITNIQPVPYETFI